MADYKIAYDEFDIARAASVLSRPLDSGINAAIECCDRWCGSDRVALRREDVNGRAQVRTFEELRDDSSRLANLLASKGISAGDRVAALLPRIPELLVTILAVWRLGAIYQPLFTAFGPKAIEHRLRASGAKMIITNAEYSGRLAGIDCSLLRAVTSATSETDSSYIDLSSEVPRQSPRFEPVLRTADDPFLIMFTSGTTGPAKSLLVPLKAIAAFVGYMTQAIELRTEDSFWNVADPGWAYGLYYAVTGPLAMGHTTLFYDGPFTVESTVRVVKKYGITNLAGSPTAYRLLIGAGPEALSPIKGQLRVVSSAGEPLNPEVIRWFGEHLAAPIYDHYGQTELGMVVCNHHGLKHPVHLGSAGLPVPGHRVVVLNDQDRELGPAEPGILAVDKINSPLYWFDGYEGADPEIPSTRYYRSGDTVELNDDGSISFVGRSDDVITSSGYRIGPFDVESALIEHPAVLEAAVIGKPDPERTEIVKAFVVLKDGQSGSLELADELKKHVRNRLSAHAYPREIEFTSELPKTPSGKIQRFLLRNREVAQSEATA